MNNLLKICSIVSMVIAAIKLALIGNLSPGMVVFILVCGLLILVGNRTIYIITAAVAALVLFIKVYGGNNPAGESALLGSVLTLVMVCVGFYVMFKGMFSSSGRRRDS
ncbi:MAG: hypothetical protein U0Y10_04520 [Spirosomataceae bacterium]